MVSRTVEIQYPGEEQPRSVEMDIPEYFDQSDELTARYVNNVYLPYLDSGLQAAEQDTNHPLSALPDFAARGFYRLGQIANMGQVFLGLDDPENAAKDIKEYEEHIKKAPYDKDVLEVLKQIDKAETVGDFWDAVSTPAGLQTIGTVAGESLATFAPALAGSALAALATKSMVVAGAVSGLGSFAVEHGASALEALQEYMREDMGMEDPLADDKAVASVLGNEEKMEEFKEFGVKRGVPIAVLDALSVGIAGKLTAAVRNSTKAAREAGRMKYAVPAAVAVEALAIQPSLGSLGEYAAQKASGQEFKLGEVLLEGVAELPGGTIETALGTMIRNEGEEAPRDLTDNILNNEEKEVKTIGAAVAQAKYLDSISKSEEEDVVKKDLAAGGEKAQPFIQRLVDWVGNENIREGDYVDKTVIDKIFNFQNKKSKKSVISFLENEGYITTKKGSDQLTFTSKAAQELNLSVLEEQEATAVQDELGIITEEQPDWITDVDPNGEVKVLPENVSMQEARQLGFIAPRISEKMAIEIGEREGLSPEEAVEAYAGKYGYRISDKNDFQLNLHKFLTQKEQEKVAKDKPFLVPGKVKTSVSNLLKKLGLEKDRSGNVFETAEDVADEYTQLQETDHYLGLEREDAVAKNDNAKKEAIDESRKILRDRIKRMNTLFNSGIWKREGTEAPQPYYKMEPGEERDLRVDNIRSQLSLDDPNYSILPETTKAPENVIVDTELQEFLDAADMRLAQDPDQQLTTEIMTIQSISQSVDPEQPASNEIDPKINRDVYLQDLNDPVTRFYMTDHELLKETNPEMYAEAKRRLAESHKNLDEVDLTKKLWGWGWKITHPMRLAEKFPAFRPVYNLILKRRSMKLAMDAFGFSNTDLLFSETNREQYKVLSNAAVILDALGGTSTLKLVKNPDGGVTITVPEKPATIKNREDLDIQEISDEDYRLILANLDIKPGHTIRLDAPMWERYNQARKSIDRMYERVGIAFVRNRIQKYPLHGNIKEAEGDTLSTLKEKLQRSVLGYIDDINKVMDMSNYIDTTELKDNVSKIKLNDKIYKALQDTLSVKEVNENELAKKKLEAVIDQFETIKLIDDHQGTVRRNPYYMPRQRYGDYYFTVTNKKTGKQVHYQTSNKLAFDLSVEQQEKRLKEELKELKNTNRYPSSEYEFSKIKYRDETKDILNDLDMQDVSVIQRLANNLGFYRPKGDEKGTQVEAFINALDKVVTTDGFNKYLRQREPARVIHGYYTKQTADTYLPFSLSQYVRTAADTISNLEYYRPLRNTTNELGEHSRSLFDTAQKLIDNINNPSDPGSLAKAFTFHYAIGMNVSSAMINLSQLFVSTLPVLKTVIGHSKGKGVTRNLMSSARAAWKLGKFNATNIDKYGFNLESPKVPDHVKGVISQDEWEMLRDLYNKGVIQAVMNIDQGATYQAAIGEYNNKLPGNTANKLSEIMEVSAFSFGFIEQLNRITTALATYRLAKQSPQNLEKLGNFSKHTAYSLRSNTPAEAAEMMVMKTQFLISKENRPELFHNGFLNVATQFMSFPLQYISMYAHAMSIAKVDKKLGSVMLGTLMMSMFFFAGAMGLPWMENLRQLIKKVSKNVGDKYEYDIKFGMEQALLNMGVNGTFTRALLSGPFGVLSGIDVSRRIGVGEIIPLDLWNGELAVVGGPTAGLIGDSIERVVSELGRDETNIGKVLSSVMPIAARNAYDAIASQVEDAPIRTSKGRVTIPGEELTWKENVPRLFGFTPTGVSEARENVEYKRFLEGRSTAPQESIYSDLARYLANRNMYARKGDLESAREEQAKFDNLIADVRQRNQEAIAEKDYSKYINITMRALRDRVLIETYGQGDPRALAKGKKAIRGMVQDRLKLMGGSE